MSMTKAEKQIVEHLKIKLALSWTPLVRPDLPPPVYGKTTSGWAFNEFTLNVMPAWSESIYHGIGSSAPESKMSGSQGSKWLYSTRLLALRAMRNEVELEAARRLRKIDAHIELEVVAGEGTE